VYSTCLFCHATLRTNVVIEAFPVGRRLAFDAARGRLWVVCRRCERWNLSPLEERWEAIDECERRFRATRLRASTDNIGLARLPDGLELVRIGAALRPEFAAWRYGDQFGRRRRKHLLYSGATAAVVGGIVIAGPVTGVIAGGSWGLINLVNTVHNLVEERRIRVRLRVPNVEHPLLMRKRQLQQASLQPGGADGWKLQLSYVTEARARRGAKGRPSSAMKDIEIIGRDALQAAGQILPQLNAKGARKSEVATAVRLIEDVGDPLELFPDSARRHTLLHTLPTELRLALEMASHEEAERRAMEGELALLDAAWRNAEEIAAIADSLLVPDDVDAWMAKAKASRQTPPA
jgi:hypothetical protein